MSRPIVTGIINELMAVLSFDSMVEEVLNVIDQIHKNDPELGDDMIIFGFTTVGELRQEEKFWENVFCVNNIVAAYLESKTIAVANPLLAVIPGITQEDVQAVINATDELQVAAVPVIIERCQEKYAVPQVVRFGDALGGSTWERKFVF